MDSECRTAQDITHHSLRMINHQVVRFHVPMYPSAIVYPSQSREQLEHVVTDVEVGESWEQQTKVDIVDQLDDKSTVARDWVTDGVNKFNDVGTASEMLKVTMQVSGRETC